VNFPAMMIGGDLYDVLEVDRKRMAVVVGDISGKGIPASLFMVRLLSEFRSQLHLRRSPRTILTRLNQMVKRESVTGMFVTFVYFLLYIEKGRLTYANAGHPPPLVYSSRSGKVARLNGAKSIPLGVSGETVFRNKTIPIESHDTLLMYTDGVIEAQNEKGEYFGIGRLEEILKRSHSSPSSLVEELLAQLEEFTGGSRNQDDSTLVAVKVF
jgi:sigma-B regulation protein RsbU (phosphoserine phosphatase)